MGHIEPTENNLPKKTRINLTITDKTTKAVVPYALVTVYPDLDSYKNNTGKIAEKNADDNGYLFFEDLPEGIKLIFLATQGCKSNKNLGLQLSNPLVKGTPLNTSLEIEGLGSIQLTSNSSNLYTIAVNDVNQITMNGNSSYKFIDLSPGVYKVTATQVSGYLFYPTVKTANVTVTECQTSYFSFP